MDRRSMLRMVAGLAVCPLCAGRGPAAETNRPHWSYEGASGPSYWAKLDHASAACGAGAQQSPLNLEYAVGATLPPLEVDWRRAGGVVVNNGHTIQVNMPSNGTLRAGDASYTLLQYHFHAPSEHLVAGRRFPMEVHFVHKSSRAGDLGVLGAFLDIGASNPAFAKLVATMPRKPGTEAAADPAMDLRMLLPKSLAYWRYEGSLTTPPCSEVVDWMVCVDPVQIDAADMAKFTALYPMNARPVQISNRRFLLRSS